MSKYLRLNIKNNKNLIELELLSKNLSRLIYYYSTSFKLISLDFIRKYCLNYLNESCKLTGNSQISPNDFIIELITKDELTQTNSFYICIESNDSKEFSTMFLF